MLCFKGLTVVLSLHGKVIQYSNVGKSTAPPIHFTLLPDLYMLQRAPTTPASPSHIACTAAPKSPGTTLLDGRELKVYIVSLSFTPLQAAEKALWSS